VLFAPKALTPIPVLSSAVVVASPDREPTKVFFAPDVMADPAALPIAVLLAPLKEPSSNAVSPKATLFEPVG